MGSLKNRENSDYFMGLKRSNQIESVKKNQVPSYLDCRSFSDFGLIEYTAILLLVSNESAGYRPALYVVQPSGFG